MSRALVGCAAALWLAAVGLQSAAATGQERPPREDPNSGPYLYRVYCASCHGMLGAGDGPAAKTLLVPLPDLRMIAKRNGGRFPSTEVAQIVDGRTALPGHLRDGMPLWGAILNRMEAQNERAVQARITALVSYLESVQARPMQ